MVKRLKTPCAAWDQETKLRAAPSLFDNLGATGRLVTDVRWRVAWQCANAHETPRMLGRESDHGDKVSSCLEVQGQRQSTLPRMAGAFPRPRVTGESRGVAESILVWIDHMPKVLNVTISRGSNARLLGPFGAS